MNTPHDKYKMFRNYMANELGITKDDIKEWTLEAVGTQVQKLIGQIDVEGMVFRNAKANEFETRKQVVNEVSKIIATKIKIVNIGE